MFFLSSAAPLFMRLSYGLLRHFRLPFSTTSICHWETDYYRLRYQSDRDFRMAEVLRCRKRASSPEGVERTRKKILKYRHADKARLALRYRESSAVRRTQNLVLHIRKQIRAGLLNENWSWKTHAPLISPTSIDHHCTACDRDRYLKVWWKEKSEASTTDEPRYMCTPCFASDPERMMPEKHPAKLSGFFRDTID